VSCDWRNTIDRIAMMEKPRNSPSKRWDLVPGRLAYPVEVAHLCTRPEHSSGEPLPMGCVVLILACVRSSGNCYSPPRYDELLVVAPNGVVGWINAGWVR